MTTVTKRFRAVDPNAPYPQNCHPRWIEAGETVSGRLAEIAVELGCAGEQTQQSESGITVTLKVDATQAISDLADVAAAAAAAAAADNTATGAAAPTRARMLKKAPGRALDGSMINYAKGSIVEGAVALEMVSAGLAEPA